VVLVADGHLANRKLFEEILETQRYRVVCASEGRQALELLRSQTVDLAILDAMMPYRTALVGWDRKLLGH
jgi:CheY-like chemotaxis protein